MKRLLMPLMAVVIGVGLGILCFMCLQITTVKGSGMLPLYEDGDVLLVSRIAYQPKEGAGVWGLFGTDRQPKAGEIVVFPAKVLSPDGEGKHLVKRVIATEGYTLAIFEGNVLVEGKPLGETYVFSQASSGEMPETSVEPGRVFVLGDNRAVSMDSRDQAVGQVRTSEIEGKVLGRIWPLR